MLYMRITWEERLSEQAKGIGNIARSFSPSLLLIKHYIFINRAPVYVNTCAILPCSINTD